MRMEHWEEGIEVETNNKLQQCCIFLLGCALRIRFVQSLASSYNSDHIEHWTHRPMFPMRSFFFSLILFICF